MSNDTDYRWYVCQEVAPARITKKYDCIQTTFEEAVNPFIYGRFVFIPFYVPKILDTVIIKSKLTDQDIKVEILTNR